MRASAVSLVVSSCLLGWTGHAANASDRRAEEDVCYTAAVDAQRLRNAADLVESREKLLICAAATCPADVVKLCTQWLSEVTASIPTVVVSAKDAADRDVVDASVTLNGRLLVDRLDGVARPVDPGTYTLRCEHKGDHAVVEQTVVIREGEKNRIIAIRFPEAESPALLVIAPTASRSDGASSGAPPSRSGEAARAPGSSTSVAGWAFTGAGVALLGTFGYLTASGQNRYDNWVNAGRPESEASSLEVERAFSFVALGAGLAATGVGVAFLIHGRPSSAPATTSQISLSPIERGGELVLRRRF